MANNLRRMASALTNAIFTALAMLSVGLANFRRRLLKRRLADYPVIVLDQSVSERAPVMPWWYDLIPNSPRSVSLESLAVALDRIGADPDVKGVLFLIKMPALSFAQAQSIADLLDRFRARSTGGTKEIVIHLESLSAATYRIACAADRVVVTPLATWEVLGLQIESLYWRETLARIGLRFDTVRIAPWKSALDMFTRDDMSDEQREQLNWLLDSLFGDLIEAISHARNLPIETVQTLVDRAPLNAQQALDAGLVDQIAYEDELAVALGSQEHPARLAPYRRVRRLLLRQVRRRHHKAIGVLSLQGSIVPGQSRRSPLPLPLLGQQTMGSRTVQQQIRAARRDSRLAALIIHVDSPGGSALASDLIWRELSLFDLEKPVIIYMGNVAASGGYYLATPGRKIVAQSATLTGSIGVFAAKAVTAGSAAKLGAGFDSVQRGQNADLYSSQIAWTPEQTRQMDEGIRHIYHEFKQRVADGRRLDYAELDPICNGRVWTGKQAKEHGLVDALGDFQIAVDLACEVADLPTDGSVRTVSLAPPKGDLLAEAGRSVAAATGLDKLTALPLLQPALEAHQLHTLLGSEPFWLIDPDLPSIR